MKCCFPAPATMALLASLLATPSHSVEVQDLYRGETIVTGTEEPERTRGLWIALKDVFVKLAGDTSLVNDQRLHEAIGNPHRFVADIEYEDRMKGIPVHDEQGTRERPHFLRARFEPAVVNNTMSVLGMKLWPADRPLVSIWLVIRTPAGNYVLTDHGSAGYGQRAVLTETAQRRGVPIQLPKAEELAVSADAIIGRSFDRTELLPDQTAVALVGVLTATPAALWTMDWELLEGSETHKWSMRDVTFDTALRSGIERTAHYLSRRAD